MAEIVVSRQDIARGAPRTGQVNETSVAPKVREMFTQMCASIDLLITLSLQMDRCGVRRTATFCNLES